MILKALEKSLGQGSRPQQIASGTFAALSSRTSSDRHAVLAVLVGVGLALVLLHGWLVSSSVYLVVESSCACLGICGFLFGVVGFAADAAQAFAAVIGQ